MSDIDKYTEKYVDDYAFDFRTTATGNFRNRKLWICKHYEREDNHDGYVTVRFRVGITNHVWWSRSFSNVWSGMSCKANKINEAEKMQIKYFDKKSGKMVPSDELDVIILESSAKKLVLEDKLHEAKIKLEEAYSKSKILHERIRNSLESVKLAIKGSYYLEEFKNYGRAYDYFQEAYNKSTELEFYTKFKQLRDSIEQQVEKEKEKKEELLKQKLKKIQLNTAAERLFDKGFDFYKQGNYQKALDKFHESYLKASPGSSNEYKYLWWKAECLSRMSLFDEAIIEYNNAISVITDPKRKHDCVRQKEECIRKKIKKENKLYINRLEEEAISLARERKFSEAEAKFQKISDNLFQDDSRLKEKMLSLMDLIRMASDGMKLADECKYEEAYHKFEDAYFKSNDHKLFKIFLAEMEHLKRIAQEQNQIREQKQIVINLEQQGINLANQSKYEEAILAFEEAKSKSDNTEVIRKIQNSLDSMRLAIEANYLSSKNEYNQSLLKYHEAFELSEDVVLRNKFLIQMNSLKLKRAQKASLLFEKGKFLSKQAKYSEAIKHFENAKNECGDDLKNSNIFSWWKAEALKKNHQFDDAIKEYEKVIPTLTDSIIKEDCISQRDECIRKQNLEFLSEKGHEINFNEKSSETIDKLSRVQINSTENNLIGNSSDWKKADQLIKLELLNESINQYYSTISKVTNSIENENCTKQRDDCLRRINEITKQNTQLIKEGLASWNRAWQNENSSKESDKHLNEAKSKLCLDFFDDESFSLKDLEELKLVIDLKLEGNKFLNEANVWKKLAEKLAEDGKPHEAIENFEIAMENFHISKEKFTEGLKYEQRFEKSIGLVDNAISKLDASIETVKRNSKKKIVMFTIEEE